METTPLDTLRAAFTDKPVLVFDVGTRIDAAGVTLDSGPLHLDFRDGHFVPLRAQVGNHTAPAGFAFEGDLVASLRFPRRGDALRFANRMVLEMKLPRDQLAPIAAGGPWLTHVDRALFVGARWAHEPALRIHGETAAEELPGVASLRDRVRSVTDPYNTSGGVLVDLATHVLTGAILADAGVLDLARTADWVDLATDTRYGGVEDHRLVADLPTDRWLGMRRDPTGASFASGGCGEISSLGRSVDGKAGSRHFAWLDCEAPPALASVSLRSNWTPVPTATEFGVSMTGTTELDLTVANGPIQAFPLALGQALQEVDDSPWRVAVTVDGGRRVELQPPPDDHETPAPNVVWVVLPAPLSNGAKVSLTVATESQWRLKPVRLTEAGSSTIISAPWARPAERSREMPPQTRITVDLTDAKGIDVIGSGGWVVAGRHRRVLDWADGIGVPHMVLSRWTGEEVPGDHARGIPTVGAHGGEGWLGNYAGDVGVVRAAIAWYSQILPPYPWTHVEVAPGRSVWTVPGLVGATRTDSPTGWALPTVPDRAAERALLLAVAAQWFGVAVRPEGTRDAWIGSVLPAAYANLAYRVLYGDKAADAWHDLQMRNCGAELDRLESMAFTAPDRRTCSAWLLSHTLLERVGPEAALGALDELARTHLGGTVRTEEVFAAIQSRTEVDLGPYVEAWVESGFAPRLEATWTVDFAGRVSGEVHSDVPFGRMEVPVQITRGTASESVRVVVENGVGRWASTAGGGTPRVDLDPDLLIPALTRSCHRER